MYTDIDTNVENTHELIQMIKQRYQASVFTMRDENAQLPTYIQNPTVGEVNKYVQLVITGQKNIRDANTVNTIKDFLERTIKELPSVKRVCQ